MCPCGGRSAHAPGWHAWGGLSYLLDDRDAHRTRIARADCVLLNGETAGLEAERQTLYIGRVEAVLEATAPLPMAPRPCACCRHFTRGSCCTQLLCHSACLHAPLPAWPCPCCPPSYAAVLPHVHATPVLVWQENFTGGRAGQIRIQLNAKCSLQ